MSRQVRSKLINIAQLAVLVVFVIFSIMTAVKFRCDSVRVA